MAYSDDEASVSDGDVTELYDFTGPATSYRYTSGVSTVSYGGNSYTPAAGLVRTAIRSPQVGSSDDLTVTMAASAAVVLAYGYSAPPRTLRLRVYRKQGNSGDVVTIWDGVVTGVSSRGPWADLRSVSQVGMRIAKQVPSVAATTRCPHRLYDGRCKVVAATYQHSTTVSSVSGSTVVVASVGAHPDQYFAKGAEIMRNADSERRIVYDQTGTTLKLNAPFPTLNPGDALTMWAGCDHLHTFHTDFVGTYLVGGDCYRTFNNVANYGGESSIPSSNPFSINLKMTRSS